MAFVLEGLEDAGRVTGPQEKATAAFIAEFRKDKDPDPMAEFIYACMLSIARNVDTQNGKGREISRNMTTLLGYIQQLEEMYAADGDEIDGDLADLVKAAAR